MFVYGGSWRSILFSGKRVLQVSEISLLSNEGFTIIPASQGSLSNVGAFESIISS